MLIRGNAAASFVIHWHEARGTLASSAYKGIPEYYVY